jgi:hypothetical protein
MRSLTRAAALVVALAAAAAAAAAGAAADDAAKPIEVPTAGADLAAPPRVAPLPDGRALVALAFADRIDVVALRTGDLAFEPAAVVARRADLLLGGRRGPRVAATKSAVVVAAITRRTKEGGGDLFAWRSTDAGATWGEAVRVSDVPGCAAEGLFDLAALADGRFVVVWLDCRAKAMRLRADYSADGAAWGGDVLAYESPDGTICECCHPAVAATPDGGAVAAFRNVMGRDRDVWTLRLARGATKFASAAKCGKGAWRIAACPMAGPSVVVLGDDVVSAWRRESHVFLAVGARAERDLGEGTEPHLLARADGVHAFWTTKNALLHLPPGAERPMELAQGATFPSAASGTDASGPAFVAWLDGKTRRARLLVLR